MNKQGRDWQAKLAHVGDLLQVARMKPQNPHSWTKLRQLLAVAKRTKARTLVEAGTYLGVTTRRCASHFDRVLTIELDPALHAKAKAFLHSCPNVTTLCGDALDCLPRVFSNEDLGDVLIFLDAHFSGGETSSGEQPEPALQEIDIIAEHRQTIAAIVIDDFRCFGIDPGFPLKSALLARLEQAFPEFRLSIQWDQVIVERTL